MGCRVFWDSGLTSNAGHVCREDQTHADAAANSCQTVANRSDGTNHYFSTVFDREHTRTEQSLI